MPAAHRTALPPRRPGRTAALLGLLAGLAASLALPARAWEPTAPVELVVPAGLGGGADQMARLIQKLVNGARLMPQPMTVVNRPGNSGIDGLMEVKAARGNPHRLLISLSNLFTSPLATGADFNWRDVTPVQLLALDQFVLWVPAAAPYQTAQDLVAAMRKAPPNSFKLGGTGSKQEDQLISVLLETAAETRIGYVPLKGGGDVAKALADREVDITVNNPIEAEALWRKGSVRPLCVFDGQPLAGSNKVADGKAWADLPTCLSAGIPVQYLMMRAIFTTPGASAEQVAYYSQVLDKVRALPEWRDFMARGAFRANALTGAAFNDWLDKANRFHVLLMRESKLKAPTPGAVPAGALLPAGAASAAPRK